MTFIIIAITCIISYMAFNNPQLRANMLFVPAAVKERGEMYRFITHGFIHGDFMHLLFNMYALYIFGGAAEYAFGILFGQTFGKLAYLLFYLAAIAASSYVVYMRHQGNYAYSALGASGAVAAVMWPYIMFAPWNWFIFPPLPAILLGFGYIAYSHYADKKGGTNIGHNAHLWGAIFGLVAYSVLCFFLEPELLNLFWTELMSPKGPGF
ncbi:rhomboid family intramembrane serine protease [Neolewinella persica]|uniref:rhomboid family intramembrane serine protease n=1 Tax=Neolewinella persica TaxID=70998 RepID=UPI0003744715|nr:rhomboid family intramembrane serine protease [Neolewinella persica]